LLENHLELGEAERQAISTFEGGFISNRPASVAALQGLGPRSGKNIASKTDRLQLSIDRAHASLCIAPQSVRVVSPTAGPCET
jgi:hypothetical protein